MGRDNCDRNLNRHRTTYANSNPSASRESTTQHGRGGNTEGSRSRPTPTPTPTWGMGAGKVAVLRTNRMKGGECPLCSHRSARERVQSPNRSGSGGSVGSGAATVCEGVRDRNTVLARSKGRIPGATDSGCTHHSGMRNVQRAESSFRA